MKYELEYTIQDFRNDAEDFNVLSGQYRKVSFQDLKNQVALVTEEAQETLDAVNQQSIVGLLDGAVDVMFVAIGLLQKLEYLGVDVDGAMKRVAEDNLSKFPQTQAVVDATVEMYKQQQIEVSSEYDEIFNRWIIKDKQNKIRKPAGFVGTNLSAFIPSSLEVK